LLTVIDTSVWIEFFRDANTPRVLQLEQSIRSGEAILGDLIFCEVLQGIRSDHDFKRVRNRLDAFPVVSIVGAEIAVQSAVNYRRLRRKGVRVRQIIDCLIATFCITHDLALLHNDRDFDPFEYELNLKVIH
jgi:hypothetical protein